MKLSPGMVATIGGLSYGFVYSLISHFSLKRLAQKEAIEPPKKGLDLPPDSSSWHYLGFQVISTVSLIMLAGLWVWIFPLPTNATSNSTSMIFPLAPLIGATISIIITLIIINIARYARPATAERWFKRLQLASSAALSFAHGGNDAQKVMGIIYVSLVASSVLQNGDAMPEWIPIVCYAAIALGTMSGGWKIVKTMGTKITKVNALEGVSAETAGALTLGITEHFGIPVSTTHTITGSIIGVGITKSFSAVKWGVTYSLIWAWVLTIPVSATLAGLVYAIIHYIF